MKHSGGKVEEKKRNKKKAKSRSNDDDTPRAFAQLMQLRTTGKGYKGLDNGRPQQATGQKRKRKAGDEIEVEPQTQIDDAENPVLKIQPGERLGDYAARVDQALPVAGLIAKNNKTDGNREQRKTKHEKKLQRLVNNWKAEEAKRIEKAQEEWDEAEEQEDENQAIWEAQDAELLGGKKGKKGRKGRRGSDAEDPWAELKKKRDKPKGVFDVVQAPPQFTRTPKEFKIKDGAKIGVSNVPNAGSVRRQEILAETRADVIARYRQMMQAKRGE